MSDAVPALLEELKPHLPEELLAAVQARLSRLAFAELKIQLLEEKLRRQRLEKFGPSGEKLSPRQLELLEQEPSASAAEVEAEAAAGAPPDASAPERKKRQRRPHPGRQTLPESLPRRVTIIRCPPEQAVCGGCGGPTALIGYDASERLDAQPAEYFVRLAKREKRACPGCPDRGVATAPLAACIAEKGLASDAVVIGAVIAKYADHCPLYRQSGILRREAGIDIGRATLAGWIMRVGDLLEPVVGVMERELLAGPYIQADETPVDVQTRDKRGKNHQAYLWQYGCPGGGTVFKFRMDRARAGPLPVLRGFAGLLQTDNYIGYEGVGGPGIVRAACWAHARRRFHDAVKLHPADLAAIRAVAAIDRLFAVDAEARQLGLDAAARHELRLGRCPEALAEIQRAGEAAAQAALPSSVLGNAIRYMQGLWPRLTVFLEHPLLELSNNVAENSMRPFALGRKNWIHIGSPEAGPRVAAIVSVVETCRRLDLPVRDYLADILPGLADRPLSTLGQLTPTAWAARRPATS